MKPEIKKKWLEALRSGEYEQGIGALKGVDGKYCCLGILCELHSRETKTEWLKRLNGDGYNYFVEHGVLPSQVVDWAGMDHPNPSLIDEPRSSLAELNDSGKTFPEIADIIEKEL